MAAALAAAFASAAIFSAAACASAAAATLAAGQPQLAPLWPLRRRVRPFFGMKQGVFVTKRSDLPALDIVQRLVLYDMTLGGPEASRYSYSPPSHNPNTLTSSFIFADNTNAKKTPF